MVCRKARITRRPNSSFSPERVISGGRTAAVDRPVGGTAKLVGRSSCSDSLGLGFTLGAGSAVGRGTGCERGAGGGGVSRSGSSGGLWALLARSEGGVALATAAGVGAFSAGALCAGGAFSGVADASGGTGASGAGASGGGASGGAAAAFAGGVSGGVGGDGASGGVAAFAGGVCGDGAGGVAGAAAWGGGGGDMAWREAAGWAAAPPSSVGSTKSTLIASVLPSRSPSWRGDDRATAKI